MQQEPSSPIRDGPPSAALFRLTEDDIHEFQSLIHETMGLWMTTEEASQRANALLTLARIIVDPIGQDDSGGGVQTSSGLPDSAEHSRLNI